MVKALKSILLFALALVVFSCGKSIESNFKLTGSIKGLKKGALYLQKDGDSTRITLDSVEIKGQPEFLLSTNIDEPHVLYLKMAKNDGLENIVPFFAAPGEMRIETTMDKFNYDAKITGSEQQKVLEDYLELMGNYNNQNLELIKNSFDAQRRRDSLMVDSLTKRSERLVRLKYAATINFALNHNDSEVAAYLAVNEIPNTSVKYMDSIYKNLTPDIKKSYYGKILGDALKDFKTKKDSLN